MIKFIRNLFYRPVTRKEVLKRAKNHKYNGLCTSINIALMHYGISVKSENMYRLFPVFNRANASRFGANKDNGFWWPCNIWDTGREDFLDWLIDYYKDDKTDLRKKAKLLRL